MLARQSAETTNFSAGTQRLDQVWIKSGSRTTHVPWNKLRHRLVNCTSHPTRASNTNVMARVSMPTMETGTWPATVRAFVGSPSASVPQHKSSEQFPLYAHLLH